MLRCKECSKPIKEAQFKSLIEDPENPDRLLCMECIKKGRCKTLTA